MHVFDLLASVAIQPIDTEFDMYTSTDGAWFVI